MITEEHLKQWLEEIEYQLQGILTEVAEARVEMKGINVGKNGEAWVSFEYLLEKATTIKGTIRCIRDDMVDDVK